MPQRPKDMDDSVAAEIASGVKEAFESYYEAYRESFFSYTNKLVGNPEIAKDIVSDTFVNCWRLRANFNTIRDIQAYMFVACRNNAYNYLKYGSGFKNKQEISVVDIQAIAGDYHGGDDIIRDMIFEEHLEAVRRAMTKLPGQMQEIIQYIYFEGFSIEEVAHEMNLTSNTVRVNKSRALAQLRELLSNHPFLDLIMIFLFSS